VALLGWRFWVALMDCPDQLIAVACDYLEILIRQLAAAFLELLPLCPQFDLRSFAKPPEN
jgi:hypothetical protein